MIKIFAAIGERFELGIALLAALGLRVRGRLLNPNEEKGVSNSLRSGYLEQHENVAEEEAASLILCDAEDRDGYLDTVADVSRRGQVLAVFASGSIPEEIQEDAAAAGLEDLHWMYLQSMFDGHSERERLAVAVAMLQGMPPLERHKFLDNEEKFGEYLEKDEQGKLLGVNAEGTAHVDGDGNPYPCLSPEECEAFRLYKREQNPEQNEEPKPWYQLKTEEGPAEPKPWYQLQTEEGPAEPTP